MLLIDRLPDYNPDLFIDCLTMLLLLLGCLTNFIIAVQPAYIPDC